MDRIAFAEADVVTASAGDEYTFVLLCRAGEQPWPMVAVEQHGPFWVVAWPRLAGPRFGGLHAVVTVPAALVDDPGSPDPDVLMQVVLEKVRADAMADLFVVELLPAFPSTATDVGHGFSPDGAMPLARALVAEAGAWLQMEGLYESLALTGASGAAAAASGRMPLPPDAARPPGRRARGGVAPVLPLQSAAPDAAATPAAEVFATAAEDELDAGRGRGRGRGRGISRRGDSPALAEMAARMEALELALVRATSAAAAGPGREPPPLPAGTPAAGAQGAAAAAAASARMRAAALIGGLQPPFSETAPGARPAAARQPPEASVGLTPELLDRVLHGGADASHALRLLELQVLSRVLGASQAPGAGLGSQIDPLSDLMGTVAGASRGAAGLQALHRTLAANPESVVREFNAAIQRELETDVTGMPWSLRTYMEQRVHFAPDQEWQQRMMTVLCRMHALHLGGVENFHRLGACVVQAFKMLEHVVRERDWQLAWLWMDLPDPRPQPGMSRGLAQASELSAAVAYLREAHMLDAQRQAAAGRLAWPSLEAIAAPRPRPTPATGEAAAAAAVTPGALPGTRNQRRRAAKAKAGGR
ncbi:MAG: hypothetical protein FJ284_08150 [Planctomycetes bacterium]|nr:hypothetical protein [Planctomycetota bacterium]